MVSLCLLTRLFCLNISFLEFFNKMVFTTSFLLRRITYSVPSREPDRFWKKRKILKMSAHYLGRAQRCYRLAIRAVNRALRYSTISRKVKAQEEKALYKARLTAACEQHGLDYKYFRQSLMRSNILINSKILTDLAIWEPRSFKCLTDFAWKKAADEGLRGINDLGEPPSGVILKPMIIK